MVNVEPGFWCSPDFVSEITLGNSWGFKGILNVIIYIMCSNFTKDRYPFLVIECHWRILRQTASIFSISLQIITRVIAMSKMISWGFPLMFQSFYVIFAFQVIQQQFLHHSWFSSNTHNVPSDFTSAQSGGPKRGHRLTHSLSSSTKVCSGSGSQKIWQRNDL